MAIEGVGCGLLYVHLVGQGLTPQQQLEAMLDQAAEAWATEVLLKGPEHPHAVAAGDEHLRLSRQYCRKYLTWRLSTHSS